MKILVMCMQCFAEQSQPSTELFLADYFDEGIAHIRCAAGHETAVLVQNPKFEVLMQSGATALLQGFTYEACASFSAALERFYEFALRVFCKAQSVTNDLYSTMFKGMKNQSERQLGAFMLVYALEFSKPYNVNDIKVGNKNLSEFRNNIVHKGYIPKLEEAHDYCSRVYEIIFDTRNMIVSKYRNYAFEVLSDMVTDTKRHIKAGVSTSTASFSMFFNFMHDNNKDTLSKALDGLNEAQTVTEYIIPYMLRLCEILESNSCVPPDCV